VDGERSREPLGIFPPGGVDWSADGSRLLVTGPHGRGAFMVKELESEQRMRVNVFHNGDLTGGCFSPDGALVMTSSTDGTLFVRDVVSGSPLVQLSGDGAPLGAASFSPGAGPLRILAAQRNGFAHIWPVDPLPSAKRRRPRELYEWEVAREVRLAEPLPYR
jgi:WD40 repeat protein